MKSTNEIQSFKSNENTSESSEYFNYHERYFEASRKLPIRLVYIDINDFLNFESFKYQPLEFWSNYFPKAKIFGLNFKSIEEPKSEKFKIFSCGDFKSNNLEKIFVSNKLKANIIIAQGDSKNNEQQILFDTLFKYLSPGGIYVMQEINQFKMGKASQKFSLSINNHPNFIDETPLVFSSKISIDPHLKYSTLSVLLNFCINSKIESPYFSPQNIS